MKNKYISPEIDIINFNDDLILTASVVAGNTAQPGDQEIEGSDIFG